MKLSILCCVLVILILLDFGDGKRGGGGSRGGSRKTSSGGGSWYWGSSSNKKSSSNKGSQPASDSIPKQPAPAVAKPSAPKNPNPEPGFKKETANVQHSSNPQNAQQRPVGWDVPGTNTNGGWKSGYQGAHQQGHSYPTGNQPQSAYGNPNQQSGAYHGTQNHNSYPHQQGQAYPQNQGHAYPQNQGHAYPQNQGHGYSGYPQNQGQGYSGYPQNQGHGYSGYPQHGGGYSGYPQQGGYGAQRGGFFGGNGGGYGGGYGGGMGGYGGGMGGFGGGMGGYGGYGMQKKSGFFSGSTFRNVLTGMFIWHMTSSLLGGFQSKRPYNVYNYYNQPAVQEEIKLPSNVLTMCEGNVTQLCTGSTAICTTNSTVLCVVTMSQATPCAEEKTLCVNATVPCADTTDPACAKTTAQQATSVSVPCLTNLTMDVNLLNETGGGKGGDEFKYCVTTMAVGGPEYKSCEEVDIGRNDWRSVLEGNYTWNLTLPTMKRPYSIYNYHHPPSEAPSGEVVIPLEVLITCPENATKLCAPELTPVCTTFNEIMCLDTLTSTVYCEEFNTTCYQTTVPCLDEDLLCGKETEEKIIKKDDGNFVRLEMPCFTNITLNTHLPNFDIRSFNGTVPVGANSSYTYHFHYCVTTLGIPGNEADVCIYGKN